MTVTSGRLGNAPRGAQQGLIYRRRKRRFEFKLNPQIQIIMLRWTILFLVIAVISAIFGFTGIAGAATDIARTLFFIFLVLLVISAIASAFRGRPPV